MHLIHSSPEQSVQYKGLKIIDCCYHDYDWSVFFFQSVERDAKKSASGIMWKRVSGAAPASRGPVITKCFLLPVDTTVKTCSL